MHNGSSEWLILSAVVIGAPNEKNVAPWRNDIPRETRSQRKDLHFTNLKPWNKRIACREIANLPVRCFVVCSNKKNMRGYQNPFAEKYPAPNWFYAWLSRLLLERVTYFVRESSSSSIAKSGKCASNLVPAAASIASRPNQLFQLA